jgi:deoxyribonuclease V
MAYCSAVITNTEFNIEATVHVKYKIKYPYIPGLFFPRESGPLLKTLALLKDESENDSDVLLILDMVYCTQENAVWTVTLDIALINQL